MFASVTEREERVAAEIRTGVDVQDEANVPRSIDHVGEFAAGDGGAEGGIRGEGAEAPRTCSSCWSGPVRKSQFDRCSRRLAVVEGSRVSRAVVAWVGVDGHEIDAVGVGAEEVVGCAELLGDERAVRGAQRV